MIRLEFKPRDFWIGIHWSRSWSGEITRRFIDVWICLLPMLPVHIRHTKFLSEIESAAVKKRYFSTTRFEAEGKPFSGPPYIDDRVKYVGVTWFRNATAKNLRKLPADKVWVVQESNGTPLVVVVPYGLFLNLQETAGVKPGMKQKS